MGKPSAHISELIFSSDQKISLDPKDKVLIVGPNNSGKSQTLREIVQVAHSGQLVGCVVLKAVTIHKEGNAKDLKAYLDANAELKQGSYRLGNWTFNPRHTPFWDQPYLTQGLTPGFIKNIDASGRLQICNQQNSIGPNDQKTQPQHILYDDPDLMTKISGKFFEAFGEYLMFDYRGGNVMPIHVGGLPDEKHVDRVGKDYVAAVRANPLLDQQGDGMKSYAGILFHTIATELDAILLDEPEAFLHPPQMRRLGETLSNNVIKQLIVATHSSDVMRGFLEGTKGNVRIIRIRRDNDKNIVFEAEPTAVNELWKQPELRYSNALEGVFHEETLLCEHDSDCRLVNAIADYLAAKDGDNLWKDTAYVPTGGKHGVKKIAGVLRSIGVPVKALFDIDFLNNCDLVKETIEAFGGDWPSFEALWKQVDVAVKDGIQPRSVGEIKSDISALLDEWSDGRPPRGKIDEALKQTSAWSIVKRAGANAIPRGNARTHFNDLVDKLCNIGIYVIPNGEIENFCPDLGLHGPKFVSKLMSEVPFDDDRLSSLRTFVEKLHKGQHSPIEEP